MLTLGLPNTVLTWVSTALLAPLTVLSKAVSTSASAMLENAVGEDKAVWVMDSSGRMSWVERIEAERRAGRRVHSQRNVNDG